MNGGRKEMNEQQARKDRKWQKIRTEGKQDTRKKQT
jgi:hypothetical protein